MYNKLERLIALALVYNDNTVNKSYCLRKDDSYFIYDLAYNSACISCSGMGAITIPDVRRNTFPNSTLAYIDRIHSEFLDSYSKICEGNDILDIFTQLMVKRTAYVELGYDVVNVETVNALIFRSITSDEHYLIMKNDLQMFAYTGYNLTTFTAACDRANVDTTLLVAGTELVPIPVQIRRMTDMCLFAGTEDEHGNKKYVYRDFMFEYIDCLVITCGKAVTVCRSVDDLTSNDIANIQIAYNAIDARFMQPIKIDPDVWESLTALLTGGSPDDCTTMANYNGVYVMGINFTNDVFLTIYIDGKAHTVFYEQKTGTAYNYQDANLEDYYKILELLAMPPAHTFIESMDRYFQVKEEEPTLDNIERVLKLCGVNTDKVASSIIDELLH